MPATEGTLGLARLDDAETIAAMSRDLIEAGLGWEYRPERVARLMLSPDNVTVVAREGERCVGFALMTFGEDRAHLVLLAVRPTHRRLGIARRMLDWLLASARAAGLLSVHLELVDDNAAARAFYRSMGFSETFRLPGYYRGRKAALRMVFVLRSPRAVAPEWRPPARA
jgi:ribosomal-protein-alanine N-acetyltransferase